MFFWRKINLAYRRYASVHRKQGGPIALISARQSQRLGEPVHEAFATLDAPHTGFLRETSSLYGNSHGTGTGRTRSEAVYRSISEALERWAWHSTWLDETQRQLLRYDVDGSTTGFAAFPGLVAAAARAPAYFEAAERWSISAWWEERIDHAPAKAPWPEVQAIQLACPVPRAKVAVVWIDRPNYRAYGFAAGPTLAEAVRKAGVELGRNVQVLEYHRMVIDTPAAAASTRNERRLLYFAEEQGRRHFDKRLKTKPSLIAPPPPLLVDRPVVGPWTKYTHVWRCLFRPTALYENEGDDYFHF